MKNYSKELIDAIYQDMPVEDSIKQIDSCLKHFYEDKTKNAFDQVFPEENSTEQSEKFTFMEIILTLKNARYDILYAKALELQYESEPIPKKLLKELGIINEEQIKQIQHLRRIK